MNGEHNELYLRIEEDNLDDPTAPYPFTARLAAENGWSVSYARRVAEEYKKFAFLAVTAGHPVTPPDAVRFQPSRVGVIFSETFSWIFTSAFSLASCPA